MQGIRRLRAAAAAAFCGAAVLAVTGPGPAAAAAGPPADCLSTITRPNLTLQQGDRPIWAQQRLGLDANGVWAVTKGAGVRVAVIDTGVDAQNPALVGGVVAGASVTAAGDREPGDYDCDGHGTGVASVIAGRPGKVFRFAGVAPAATIVPIRQTYHSGSSDSGGELKVAAAIEQAIQLHVQVINISIVSELDSQPLDDAVKDALAHNIVVVASAGNEIDAGLKYPAAIPGVLSVGAIKQDGSAAKFSEKAGALIAAPGDSVMVPTSYFHAYLTLDNGTSFAAPYVAGTAALVRAAHPELTQAQVVRRILATADHPTSGLAFDPVVGWGVVNPYRAVTAVLPDERDARQPSGTTPTPAGHVDLPQAAAGSGNGVSGDVAWGVLGAAFVGVAAPLGAVALRRGQARGWRAGA